MVQKKVGTLGRSEMIEYRFDSIWSVIEYLKNAPDNRFFREKSSETGSFDFTGTYSYGEAEKLCLFPFYLPPFTSSETIFPSCILTTLGICSAMPLS